MTPKLIKHMENGLLVRTDKEWVDALEMLVKDEGLRHRLGEAGRETALENYSIHIIKSKYLSILNELVVSELSEYKG